MERGRYYKEATELVELATSKTKISKRDKKAMKTAKMKELVKAFLKVIKKGGLFGAFLNAQGRMILNAKLQKDFQEKCEAYLKDPKDERLLLALEELEERIEEEQRHKTADGDTNILKALDFHNEMCEGFRVFDICRAKIGCNDCGVYMPSLFWAADG